MKKQIKWLLPLLLIGGVAQAENQPATPDVSAAETCELPLAESAQERAAQQIIRAMADDLAQELPQQMDDIIVNPAEEIKQEVLNSLLAVPALDRTQELNELIAAVQASEVEVTQDQMVEMAEVIRCTLYAGYETMLPLVISAMGSEGRQYVALINVNLFGLDIGFSMFQSKSLPLLRALPISTKLGGGAEISIGASIGFGIENGQPIRTLRRASGFVGAGLLAAGNTEKFFVPRMILPINNVRVYLPTQVQSSMEDFYGTYAHAGLVTMDLALFNLRGQAGMRVLDGEGAIYMVSAGSAIGQQRSAYVTNFRGYMFDNLSTVLQFLSDLTGSSEGEPGSVVQWLDREVDLTAE